MEAPSPGSIAVRAHRLTRTYGGGPSAVRALDGIDLRIEAATFVVLLGPSGSGKTTLLNLIGGIDRPTAGTIEVDGIDVGLLDRRGLTAFRRERVSFVFQFYNLVPTLTALENVVLIAELTGGDRMRAAAALRDVGLGDRLHSFPSQLSGGQQQRVAVARAMAKATPLLLADEPTGALDRESGAGVLALLREAVDRHGRTVVVVTHDPDVTSMADRVIRLLDGRVESDEKVTPPVAVDSES
ncbi:MAG: ABC transporter ATP-binding protein [Acidimicrobiales bacterium]